MGESAKTVSKDVTIINELGLHARSAAMIAKMASRANSLIWISKGGDKADASSIMDLLTLEGTPGTRLKVTAEDKADIDILNAIIALIEKGFGE